MGKEKGGFLTPKAIGNRIKAKGLQKLRWFCQMCQKQCRDENGFKCHLTSESHQRQLLLFADNPDQYIDSFSKEFLDDFTELLRRRFGTKRVHANIVYQEYIANKEHTHMNATQWETLTEFVKWLGKEGHCTVDETEKGWFVQYIDRDWEAIKKQESQQKKEKMEMDDDERTARFIEKQIQKATATAKAMEVAEATELQRDNEEEKVAFTMSASKKDEKKVPAVPSKSSAFDSNMKNDKPGPSVGKPPKPGEKRKSALDEIMQFEEQQKEKKNRKDYWLHPGIVVKIITKKLGEKYYNKKAFIKDVPDKFIAIIKLIDSGDKLKVDQGHLETVIPALGKTVIVVNGAYRGQQAILLELREKKFCCTIKIDSGPLKGRVIEKMQYEDISKLYIPK